MVGELYRYLLHALPKGVMRVSHFALFFIMFASKKITVDYAIKNSAAYRY